MLADLRACLQVHMHEVSLSCTSQPAAAAAFARQKHRMLVMNFGKPIINRVSAGTSAAFWAPI